MVSSICIDPDSDRPLTLRTAIIFFSLQSSRARRRFGFFPSPCTAVHDSRRLAGLCGYPFFDQLVYRATTHPPACRSYAVVSWPSLCLFTWWVTPATSICLAIQVEKIRAKEIEGCAFSLGITQPFLEPSLPRSTNDARAGLRARPLSSQLK